MGPSAQKHSVDDFNADNFDHSGLGFIRGAQISVAPVDLEGGPIAAAMSLNPPPGTPRWGAAYRDFLAKYYTRHAGLVAQTENLPYADQTIDLDDRIRDAWGLPAPRMNYNWRRPNELKRIEFMRGKLEDWPRHGCVQGLVSPIKHEWANGAPRGRHAHGERPEEFGGEPLRSELGHP